MGDGSPSTEQLQREVAYYKRKLDELAGANLKLDYTISGLQHDLKQRRQGFAVLVELQRLLTIDTPLGQIFDLTIRAINATLEMDRSAVFVALRQAEPCDAPPADGQPAPVDAPYRALHVIGAPEALQAQAGARDVLLPPELLARDAALLGNSAAGQSPSLDALREALELPFLIGLPVLIPGEPAAFLVSGRLAERPPFRPRLDDTDVATLRAISGLVHASLQNKRTAMVELANTVLAEKNEQLSQALQRLRETQKQLVVQEKLASLGALTAGIAHEIKNPLNFINNFAELSVGLTDDLLEAVEQLAGQGDAAAEIEEIAADLRQNASKIREHGKRANSIVTGMLEHSRHSTGERRETDVNALVRQIADLAIQGQRSPSGAAVAFDLDLDPGLPPVRLAPQEIGRVLLNLLANAWWAATHARRSPHAPRVWASTRDLGDRVEIRVGDNGDGIPPAIRAKIFTPFFTTKPTGEGVGLGLSLSHEIATSHGGSMVFESEEGAGTTFILTLPKTSS